MARERYLICFGTRPEAIKLFPLIIELKSNSAAEVIVCATGQHGEIFDQVLETVGIEPDVNLGVMRPNQSLEELSARLLTCLSSTIDEWRPTRVIVQGDTASAMAASLAAYYRKLPVAHVEAGLRSRNIYHPWPEEVNRKIIASIADLHFAPTRRAANSLLAENVPEKNIVVTGNTVVDALLHIKNHMGNYRSAPSRVLNDVPGRKKLILATCHRRENFGKGVQDIAMALRLIARRDDVHICLSVHPNPNVKDVFIRELNGEPNISLVEPLSYIDFVDTLLRAELVLTDSGGVQEEAPTFGKPVLVMRDTTERPEGVEAGTARLVGSDRAVIFAETVRLLEDRAHYERMSHAHNPFGDGRASRRIAEKLAEFSK